MKMKTKDHLEKMGVMVINMHEIGKRFNIIFKCMYI